MMSMAGSERELSDGDAERIAVVLGYFGALVGRGLTETLRKDRNLRIIETDLDRASLEYSVARQMPQVAVLDEAAVVEPSILRCLRAAQPAIGIIVLAHRPALEYRMGLLAWGASCLSKEVSADGILAAVYTVADGRQMYADSDGHLVEQSRPATIASLTPREVEVLEYLSRGRTHGEIACILQLGPETVRTHSAHIRAKLGVRSSRELIGLPIPFEVGKRPSKGRTPPHRK